MVWSSEGGAGSRSLQKTTKTPRHAGESGQLLLLFATLVQTIYVSITAQILLLTSINRLSQCLYGSELQATLLTENTMQLHFNKLATKRQTFF